MKRHAKTLQRKAKANQVRPSPDGTFTVTSATSGNEYTVFALANGEYRCTCKWAEYHPQRPCTHMLAVQEWLAQAGRASLSFWGSEADAERQRRPVERVGPGLLATRRRAYTRS